MQIDIAKISKKRSSKSSFLRFLNPSLSNLLPIVILSRGYRRAGRARTVMMMERATTEFSQKSSFLSWTYEFCHDVAVLTERQRSNAWHGTKQSYVFFIIYTIGTLEDNVLQVRKAGESKC
jgi:hypothetical protein